jgi:hypothetical protein
MIITTARVGLAHPWLLERGELLDERVVAGHSLPVPVTPGSPPSSATSIYFRLAR